MWNTRTEWDIGGTKDSITTLSSMSCPYGVSISFLRYHGKVSNALGNQPLFEPTRYAYSYRAISNMNAAKNNAHMT